METAIGTLRAFNRSFTQRIGALDDSFLGSGRPLGPARLLYEIGPDGTPVAELRARLGLDSGYLSRLLRQLEADGSVTVVPDPADRRRRLARLTELGLRAWGQLDQRSDEVAGRLIEPLSVRQRRQLVEALTVADRLLRLATIDIAVVDPRTDPARRALAAYFDELDERFSTGFDAGEALEADLGEFIAPRGSFLLARSDGTVAACGAVQRIDADTGEIKRMWVDPAWRGLGLGWRMLAALERRSGDLGYRTVVLDTNASLAEAIALYESAGYEPTDRYNDNPYAQLWFAKSLA